jgi:hypothetical protein
MSAWFLLFFRRTPEEHPVIMKQIFALIALALSVVAARADFVIQQKIESTEQNGIVTLKFKDDKTRRDMPTERVGDVSIIQDLNTGDTITMIHRQKAVRKESGTEFKQRMEQMDDGITNAVTPKPVDTGRTEKVDNYDTEIYSWTNSSQMSGTFWVAKNYPDYQKIRPLYLKLEQSPAGQMVKRTTPGTSAFPGMVVKSQIKSPMGETIKTLISAKEEPVAASDFQIPEDYQIVNPQAPPGHPTSPPNR